MKKLMALILTVVLVLSFSVSAFALKSPGGNVYHEVIIDRTNANGSDVDERVTVKENSDLEIKPVGNDEKEFEGFEFFKPDMSAAEVGKDFEIVKVTKEDGSAAVKGTDYDVINGKVVSKNGDYINVTIKPLVDTIYVSEAYKGGKADFNPPKGTVNSPVTGMSLSVVMMLVAVVLGGVALMVASRKKVNA